LDQPILNFHFKANILCDETCPQPTLIEPKYCVQQKTFLKGVFYFTALLFLSFCALPVQNIATLESIFGFLDWS
jgi:hypothetical protein